MEFSCNFLVVSVSPVVVCKFSFFASFFKTEGDYFCWSFFSFLMSLVLVSLVPDEMVTFFGFLVAFGPGTISLAGLLPLAISLSFLSFSFCLVINSSTASSSTGSDFSYYSLSSSLFYLAIYSSTTSFSRSPSPPASESVYPPKSTVVA